VLAGEYRAAKATADGVWAALMAAAVRAVESGVSESEAARVAQVDRMTVRKALGK
jgi:hypothetical protein